MTRTEWEPPRLQYIWRWFTELSPCREMGYGAGAITHREIAAWSTLKRIGVTPSEVAAIRAVDVAFLAWSNAKNFPESQQPISVSDALGNLAASAKAQKDNEQARRVMQQAQPISRKGG